MLILLQWAAAQAAPLPYVALLHLARRTNWRDVPWGVYLYIYYWELTPLNSLNDLIDLIALFNIYDEIEKW